MPQPQPPASSGQALRYVPREWAIYTLRDGQLHAQDNYNVFNGKSYIWRYREVRDGQIVITDGPIMGPRKSDGAMASQDYPVNTPFELLEVVV